MTDLKQVHTYMDPDMIEKVKARAKQYNMTVSKYLEYLVIKDLQREQRSTTKGNITLAYKYKRLQAYFFFCKVLLCAREGKGASGFWIEQNGNNQPKLYVEK